MGLFTTIRTEKMGRVGLMGDLARGTMAATSDGLALVAGGGKFSGGTTTTAFGCGNLAGLGIDMAAESSSNR